LYFFSGKNGNYFISKAVGFIMGEINISQLTGNIFLKNEDILMLQKRKFSFFHVELNRGAPDYFHWRLY
jgi:hypothetical protein